MSRNDNLEVLPGSIMSIWVVNSDGGESDFQESGFFDVSLFLLVVVPEAC